MRDEPLEMQYLQTIQKRTKLTTKERLDLEHVQTGYQGECLLDKWTKEALIDPESYLDDVNLSYKGSDFQVDKLLVQDDTLYVIDVKNYNGAYSYHDGCWYYDDRVLPHNIFEQLTRAQGLLARCLSDQKVSLKIQSVLVFTSTALVLDIQEPPTHIAIKNLVETYEWLAMFKQGSTEVISSIGQNKVNWKQSLIRYFVPPYREAHDFSRTPHRPYRRGICCPQCTGFLVSHGRFTVICHNCGFVEAKEHAYVRTICDYGVMYFRHDIKRRALCEFFGADYSERYIQNMLYKYFVPKTKGNVRNFAYVNKGVKFQYWFRDEDEYFRKIQSRVNWGKR